MFKCSSLVTLRSKFIAALCFAAAMTPSSRAQAPLSPQNNPLLAPNCVTQNNRLGVDTRTVTGANPCNATAVTAQGTQCWYSMFFPQWPDTTQSPNQYIRGFPMNLSLAFGPAAPDYPPLTTDVVSSNSALVPAQGGMFRGPMSYPTRGSINGVVDVITGSPLLREVDFELPFGGATFRHIRTYSEPPPAQWHESEFGVAGIQTSTPPSGEVPPVNLPAMFDRAHARATEEIYWDWHGHGWMMGENPAFLFDAHYDMVVRKPLPDGSETPPRCYFLIDAHQSIPFERTTALDAGGRPLYIAPPQFDAKMAVLDGVWNNIGKFWTQHPTQVVVWTHNGTVKYNILIGHGDAPWVTKTTVGQLTYSVPLTPLLGLVQEIRDRSGNRTVMDYLEVTRFQAMASFTVPDQSGCLECQQGCHRRGTLRSAKLFAAGKTVPDWTVLYVYREFADNRWGEQNILQPFLRREPNGDLTQPPEYEYAPSSTALRVRGQLAIHGIYAYMGDVVAPADPIVSAALLDAVEGSGHQLVRQLDAVALRGAALFNLPSNWVYECRYMYGVPWDWRSYDMAGDYPLGNNRGAAEAANIRGQARGDSAPRLLRTTVAKRELSADVWQDLPERTSLYRYGGFKCHGGNTEYALSYLAQVSLPEQTAYALEFIRKNIEWNYPNISTSNPCGQPQLLPSACVNDELVIDEAWLLMADPSSQVIYWDEALGVFGKQSLGNFATIDNSHHDSERYPHFGYGQIAGGGFHIGEAVRLANLTGLESRLLAIRSGNLNHRVIGGEGRYQVRAIARFMLRPESTYPQFNMDALNGLIDTVSPCASAAKGQPRFARSISHFPYRYVDNASLRHTPSQWLEATTGDAQQPFWVIVVKQADIRDYVADGTQAVSQEAFNHAMRVVKLNRAGLILSDVTFPIGENSSAEWVATGPDSGEIREYDVAGRLKVLKTRGYTVGGPVNAASQGLILEYDYFTNAPSASSFSPLFVGQYPNDLKTVSAKRGDQGARYLLEQFWYDPADSSLVTRHRKFTQPIERDSSSALNPPSSAYFDVATSYVWSQGDGGVVINSKETRSAPVTIDATEDLFAEVRNEVYNNQNGMLATECEGMRRVGSAGSLIIDDRNTRFCTSYAYATFVVDGITRTSSRLVSKTEDVMSSSGFGREDGTANFPAQQAQTTYIPNWLSSTLPPITVFPNGSREYRMELGTGPGRKWKEVHTYRNVRPKPNGGFSVESLVQVDKVRDGTLFETTLRSIPEFGATGPTLFTPANAPILSTLRPQFDTKGRPVEAAIDASSLAAGLQFEMLLDTWGNPVRTRDIHGNITRSIYTHDGLLEKTYKGTNDWHEVWGSAYPNGDPCTAAYSDNLVLTEKLSYGNGEKDARQVISSRRYDTRPLNQYFLENCSGVPTNNEDITGKVETYGYDWQMRRVWTQKYETGVSVTSAPVSVTAQYLDTQGRVRFEAVYRTPNIPSSRPGDPRQALPDDTVPSASQLLAYNPSSLTENLYDGRGNVAEVRTYKTDDGTYLASRSLYDHENRVVWSSSPDAGTVQTWYDAFGKPRLVFESANGLVTRRVEYECDIDGNVIKQLTRERTHDGTGSDLNSSNSVTQVSFSWYRFGQLIATADLGSDSTADTWGGTLAGTVRPSTPPSYLAGVIQLNGLPSYARVQLLDYDQFGRQNLSVTNDGTATRTQYDDFGRVTLVIENADAQVSLSHLRRATAYKYDDRGRLSQVAAVPGYSGSFDWNAVDGSVQVTRLVYDTNDANGVANGAKVVARDFSDMSPPAYDASKIARINFPNPKTGQPDPSRGFEYAYLPGGQLAMRTDLATQATLKYTYDSRDNLTQLIAVHPTSSSVVTDMTSSVTYTYDELSRLVNVWARNEASATVAMDGFAYDKLGNLKWEIQQHGQALSTLDGRVDYVWDYSPATSRNSNRISTIKYPDRDVSVSSQRREVMFAYGTTGSVSDVLSQISTISDRTTSIINGTTSSSATSERSQYSYSAGGTRTAMTLGAENGGVPAVARWQAWSGNTTSGYTQFNRFGQPLDLHATNLNGAGTTLYRAQHTYDNLGNRRTAQITQATSNNTRSWKFDYDSLQRLVKADMGALSGGAIVNPVGGFVRSTDWNLDALGNWTGRGALAGRVETGVFGSGSTITTRTVTHRMAGVPSPSDVNGDNIIKQLFATNSANPSTPTTTNVAYDASGNLICDQDYIYFYDAFNRLVQVSLRGDASVNTNGDIVNIELMGPWVRHFTYDGLGRLIRSQSPYPQPSFDAYVARSERFYYDGLRRIQEVHVNPINVEESFAMSAMTGEPGESGGPIAGETQVIEEEIAAGNVTGQTPLAEQMNITIGPGPQVQFDTWIDREYVWAPGDRGFDELVCQHTPANSMNAAKVDYALHDETGDLVALLNRVGGSASGHGQVAWEASYDPYGQPRTTQQTALQFASEPRIGHKGLFLERLDTTAVSVSPRLTNGGRVLYHARNRWLHPTLGRWTSRDPNGLGQPVQQSWSMHGLSTHVSLASPDIKLSWADGANLHQYVRDNPQTGGDAMGLTTDPFAIVDEIIAEHILGYAVALEKIESYLSDKERFRNLRKYETLGWAVAELIWDRDEAILLGMVIGPFFSTTCFVEGTTVWTPDGLRPIEKIKIGDHVVSAQDPASQSFADGKFVPNDMQIFVMQLESSDQSVVTLELLRPTGWLGGAKCGDLLTCDIPELFIDGIVKIMSIEKYDGAALRLGHAVTGIFRTSSACVLDVRMLSTDNVLTCTPSHPFFSISRQCWIAAEDLQCGESVMSLNSQNSHSIIASITERMEREEVFNIEVAGTHTYFVGDEGVWVHNACFKRGSQSVTANISDETVEMSVDTIHSLDDLADCISDAFGWAKRSSSSQDVSNAIMDIKWATDAARRALSDAAESGRTYMGGKVHEIGEGASRFWRVTWTNIP